MTAFPGASALLILAVGGVLLGGCSAGEPARSGAGRGDVFVIVIDTLRRDALRTFEPASPVGTHLDDLARDGVVFDDLRSGTSWTRPAVASLLTGLDAQRHGVHGRRDVLPADGPHLAEALQAAGFETFAWSANPNVLPIWGFDRGFDHFVDLGAEAEREPGRIRAPKVDGRTVFDRVLEALDRTSAGSFHYVHVIDPHRPYRPTRTALDEIDAMGDAVLELFPVAVDTPNTGVLRDHDFRRYMGEVFDVDAALGEFIEGLKARGRYDAATILVVSDHGEEFLEHGGIDHGSTLYEEVLRVPGLLKQAHGRGAQSRIATPAELADLMPTLLASLDVPIPGELDGRDVQADRGDPGRARFANLFLDRHRISAIYDPPYKLIVDHVNDRVVLHDLERDPGERLDLARREPARTQRMHAALDHARARHAPGWHLRGCGCRDREARIAFDVELAGGEMATIGLEDERDAIRPGADAISVLLDLAPSAEDRADRDELVLTPAVSGDATEFEARLRPLDPLGLPIAIGRGSITTRRAAFALEDDRAGAHVDASAPIDCGALVGADRIAEVDTGDLCTPHLRVWHVEAAPARRDDLDVELKERLRALGYAE